MALKIRAKSKKNDTGNGSGPGGETESGKEPGKDLGNLTGFAHSAIAAHFRSSGSGYPSSTYNPIAAFLPGRLLKWIANIAKYWFQKKHAFRDYSAPGKGTGVFTIEDRV